MPALAAASFIEDTGQAEPSTEGHQVRMSVSEEDSVGRTTRIRVSAPRGFTITGCDTSALLWGCEVVDGRTLTYAGPGSPQLVEFRFTVTTPSTPGPYPITVTQSASEEEGAGAFTSELTFTVLGEVPSPEPSPSPSPTPAPSPSPTASDGGAEDPPAAASDDADGDGSDDTSAAPSADDGQRSDDEAASPPGRDRSGGSTAPTRTQGRSNGTTLEIVPGEPSEPAADPAAPVAADQPAVAPPAGSEAPGVTQDADTVAAGQETAQQPQTGAVPWQQLVGAALLLVAGATLAIRHWDLAARLRGLDPAARLLASEPIARLRRWRRR